VSWAAGVSSHYAVVLSRYSELPQELGDLAQHPPYGVTLRSQGSPIFELDQPRIITPLQVQCPGHACYWRLSTWLNQPSFQCKVSDLLRTQWMLGGHQDLDCGFVECHVNPRGLPVPRSLDYSPDLLSVYGAREILSLSAEGTQASAVRRSGLFAVSVPYHAAPLPSLGPCIRFIRFPFLILIARFVILDP
jgi:hypothetical protein